MSDTTKFLVNTFMIIMVGLAYYVVGKDDGRKYYQKQAIERGYALYCPTDKKFAWKGECSDE